VDGTSPYSFHSQRELGLQKCIQWILQSPQQSKVLTSPVKNYAFYLISEREIFSIYEHPFINLEII